MNHLFVIMVESTIYLDNILIKNRYASKIIQHIVINSTYTDPPRRRLITSTKPPKTTSSSTEGGYASAINKNMQFGRGIPGMYCATWKNLDEELLGAWYEKARLLSCPDQDPSGRIEAKTCQGPWQVDDETDNCIKSPRGQQCCYSDGKLCTEAPCAGTADISGGNNGNVAKHYLGDVLPNEWCKASTSNDNNNNGGGINDYYDRRPVDKGGGGSAQEACAPVGGDPHFVTFDLFNYPFNGIGDYYYLYHDSFKVIIRMKQFNEGSVITKLGLEIDDNSSYALNRSDSAIIDILEVSINEESIHQLSVYMNGEIMLWTESMYGIYIKIGDVAIKYDETHIIIRCDFGVFIEIWLRNIDDALYFIELTVDIDSKYKNTVSGLIGNYDDDESNDLQSRNGTIFSELSSIKQIHYGFGLSWLLNENDSHIFHDPFLSDIEPFEHEPLFGFDNVDSDLLKTATEICGDEFPCIYDVIATEVAAIANTTLEFVEFAKETAETIKILYNVTEIITPSPTLEGCVVAESMNLYLLVDSNCNIAKSQCIEQQQFITALLQRIRSSENGIHQLFGYIEYGNGANTLFSLNDDFDASLETIGEITDCNTLHGEMNHPYYAIQTAMSSFKHINNDYNNIILIISECPASIETDHLCSVREEFGDENIELFVINNKNEDNYRCLVNDKNHQMLNIKDYNDNIDSIINSICSWTGITTNKSSYTPTNDPSYITSTKPPYGTTTITVFSTEMSMNNPSNTTTTTPVFSTEPTEFVKQDKTENTTFVLKENWIYCLAGLGSICLLIICCHWCYICNLKKSHSPKNKYDPIEKQETGKNNNKSEHQYTSIRSEHSRTSTNDHHVRVIEMDVIAENH